MTVVLVNGNPETPAVWRPLIVALAREDIVTLAPPGFGARVPEGFGATYDEYVGWLVAELESIGEPVDLVGHDWGANFSFRVACERPDLLRSWAIDTAGGFAPDYSFPGVSRVWQTPGEGEKAMANWLAMGIPERTALNEALGMTVDAAGELAAAFDKPMTDCILAVYRSVPQPVLAHWGARATDASQRPGLVVIPTGDQYTGTPGQHQWLAEQAGARVAVLEGLGHWWMLQDPAASAEALSRFWANL